jgi:hypothetical protein
MVTRPRHENTLRGVGSRRRLPGCAVRADVQVLPFDGRVVEFWGRTDDVCHRGLFVRSSQRIAVGSLLVLKIHTEMGMLRLTGRVVHSIENIGFGCEFVDVDSRQEAALSFLIALTNSAPAPVRNLPRGRPIRLCDRPVSPPVFPC